MSKLTSLILFALIAFTLSLKIKSKTGCVAEGGDCDLTSYCCVNLSCKDYRCAPSGTEDNQVPWAPLGYKCDYFHHCSHNYVCQSHRCEINKNKIVKTMKKQVNKAYKEDFAKSKSKQTE